jgi:hypothetical protein
LVDLEFVLKVNSAGLVYVLDWALLTSSVLDNGRLASKIPVKARIDRRTRIVTRKMRRIETSSKGQKAEEEIKGQID